MNEKKSFPDSEQDFEPAGDGMSPATAQVAIDKKLRKKLIKEYDLLGLENKGIYYAATALTKDGQWRMELLIHKETGEVQVVQKKKNG